MNCELCGRTCKQRSDNTYTCQCGGGAILYYFHNKSGFRIDSSEGFIKHIIIFYGRHNDYFISNGDNIYYIEQNYKLCDNYYSCTLYHSTNGKSKLMISDLPTKELVEYCKSILLFT